MMAKRNRHKKKIRVSLIPCKPTHTITLDGEKKDWGLRDNSSVEA